VLRALERRQLRARLSHEMAAQVHNADVVPVQMFVPFQTRLAIPEHSTILFEYRPVACLEAILVKKPPHVALPAADLPRAPEERGGRALVDRRRVRNDAEVAARSAAAGYGISKRA